MTDAEETSSGAKLVTALTILDWVGLLMIAPPVLVLISAPWIVTPSFRNMFEQFGTSESLPAFCRFVMLWWVPPSLAALPAGLFFAAVTGRRSLSVRRLLGVAGILAGVAAVVAYLVGLYQPVFSVADSVR